MSMNKYETLKRALDFFDENKLNWSEMSDEEVQKILSQIKGIGTWTIDMILLYTLQRPDIFPADDYHLKKIMCNLYDINTTSKIKAQLKAVSEYWSPHKSLAVKHLLAWKAFQKIKH